MKTSTAIYLTFLSIFSSYQTYSQPGPHWTPSNFGYNYIFRGIDFPSNQNMIGFAAGESLTYQGDGIVLKTTNGGNTWTQVWAGAGKGVEASCFVDLQNGFIAGWPKQNQGWSGFGKTTNGGTTWTSMPVVNDLYYFTDVVFKDADNGIVTGATNTSAGVWVTSNGGSSWTSATGLAGVPYHACYISGSTYFLCDNAGNIQKSTNNGLSWTTVFSQPGMLLIGIDNYDENIIMAGGDYGVIVKSYDGGVTWEVIQVGNDLWHDFAWESPDDLFVCGTPEIVSQSSDGGVTWINGYPQSTYQSALYECTFTQDGHGFICGSQGMLLKRNPSCGAAFSSSETEICTSAPIAFTDESWGNTAWNWYFEGGTPSSSTEQNPVVTWNTPGSYDVRLIVSNQWWSDTLLRVNYISALQAPLTPVIVAGGYTLASNVPSGNQWYLNSQIIPGANAQTYEAVASGLYFDIASTGNCFSDTSNSIYIVIAGTKEVSSDRVTISPVPNNGNFSVTTDDPELSNSTAEVYNYQGKLIFSQKISSGTLKVNLPDVADGLYLLVIRNMQRTFSRTIRIAGE